VTTTPSAPVSPEASVASRPIVVGVDGSPSSLDALRWAVRQAALVGAEVHAVIAWQYPAVYGMYAIADEVNWADMARETAEAALKEALGGDAGPVTLYVVEGHPAKVLVDKSADAEMVVVGSRGHGGFTGMLLGSVSEQVVAHAGCPVLVIHHPTAA
jgi:nucleotide-binding universal stress UspA family protein